MPTGDAYVVEINIKSASNVIKVLDSAFPRDQPRSFQHLRRFAKRTQLPESLQEAFIVAEDHPAQTIYVLIPPPLPEVDLLNTLLHPFAPLPASPPEERTKDVYLTQRSGTPASIRLHTTRIPLQPPLNQHQADVWTKSLWPVTFNPATPRALIAPPPKVLNQTQESIRPLAGHYLAVARQVAEEAARSGLGRGVGAVVVDPSIENGVGTADGDNDDGWMQAIVAVAGDARYSRREGSRPSQAEQYPGIGPNPASKTYNADLEGGPELHALMRAADMVARRRREGCKDKDLPESSSLSPLESHFLYPLAEGVEAASAQNESSPGEKRKRPSSDSDPSDIHASEPLQSEQLVTSRIRTRAQGGYLCTDLDIYITHEPCLCCSMGMVLSRFRAVIFPRQGRMVTGGIASEPVVSPIPPPSAPEAESTTTTTTTDAQEPEREHESESQEKPPESFLRERRNYYGLHWRKELNWRALAFEFVEDPPPSTTKEESLEEGQVGKVDFHA
ncbi:hypothetical protein MAP00_003359 [Monascus purpureus]|nr:hypothetical protein MAP00_003359 [Monascus purpureus]